MRRWVLLAFCFALPVWGQGAFGPGASSANAVQTIPYFIPTPGHYTTAQTVQIFCPGSKTATYETDGSLVDAASTEYTSGISISSNTTFQTICTTIGAYQSNPQTSGTCGNCYTAAGGTYPSGTICGSSGGVTGSPANVTFTFGGSPVWLVQSPSGAGAQALSNYLFGGNTCPQPTYPVCDSCLEIVKNISFTVTGTASFSAINQEHDSVWYDNTHGLNMQNGTQCEGSGGVIQVDSGNAGGIWRNTIVPCTTWTPGSSHVEKNAVSRVIGDTGCGGNGCANYEWYWTDGTNYTLNGNYGGTQGYNSQSGSKAYGMNIQTDISSSSATAGWDVTKSSVALTMADESPVVTATYTIP